MCYMSWKSKESLFFFFFFSAVHMLVTVEKDPWRTENTERKQLFPGIKKLNTSLNKLLPE